MKKGPLFGGKVTPRLPIGHVKILKKYRGAPTRHPRAFIKVAHVKGRSVYRNMAHFVWEEANGPMPEGTVIHHIDRNPLNNSIENLECVTPKQHIEIHRREAETARKPMLERRTQQLEADLAMLMAHPNPYK